MSKRPAMHKIVVMGVAGSGKSTVAARVAAALDCPMIEGDHFHLSESQDKMRNGMALADSDREPWLDRLGQLMAWRSGDIVVTCSALKRNYRERLRERASGVRFVFIDIDLATAVRRVGSRPGHLFPPSLVASQFAALESPVGEQGVFCVPATLPLERQVEAIRNWLVEDSVTSDATLKGSTV